ncbi:FAD-binding oxidoreductase [Sphingomonas sp. 28-62-11]|uniref:FAD-binding oxidoreductase n=1 Tax=Sphingomonas sp. 28-62-11 TaxID=1970432 RepID=UPI0035A9340C
MADMDALTAPPATALLAVREALAPILGDRLTDNMAQRSLHGVGEAFHPTMPPDLVAFVHSTDEVQAVVRACAEHDVPIIAFGAGTSLEGGVAALHGGVSIDMTGMNQILHVNPADLDCAVQAGVTREQLNAHLRDQGLTFPIDPGANATIGGMAATRASGTTAVRYGTMRDNVLWLTVVLPNGDVIRTARRARKSSAGYDLTRLFVGSEGTLGIITEIGLRLHGIAEAIAAAVCAFDTLAGATDCVIDLLQLGVPVARVELMDAVQVRACNRYSKTSLEEKATLLFEFHGSEAGVREQAELVGALASGHGGGAFRWATQQEERRALWHARHNAYHAAQALQPGAQLIVTDVCVPISRLSECITATHDDLAAAGVTAPIVGHVGDGNFHVFLCVDPTDPADIARARALNDRLVDRALAMDGTCTGEHGIGMGKRTKLIDELGDTTVEVMRTIKQALDPKGLFNPGKLFASR